MIKFIKKPLIIVILIIGGVILSYAYFSKDDSPEFDFIVVQKGDLIQEVSVTGKVKPAKSVDLQFENSGRVTFINTKVGDKVFTGKVLASLDTREPQAQILEKEAALDSAKADLEQIIKNFNSLQDPNMSTALRIDLENAQNNLENIEKKADDDLDSVYNDGFNAMNEAMIQADSSFTVLKNLRELYFSGTSVEDTEKLAEDELFGLVVYNRLGTKDYVAIANSNKTFENIDTALDKLSVGLEKLKNAFSALQSEIQDNLSIVSSTDRDKANSEANIAASEFSDVLGAIQDISSQKIINAQNISDAQAQLATSQAAFPTEEDISKKQSAVKQAEASLLVAQAQLRKSLIIAPFKGIVTKIEVEKGETITSSQIIISLISISGLQLEADIIEVDIVKVEAGDEATFTLDAYGQDTVFKGVVIEIDPAETIIEGVTTYKTTLQIEKREEEIKPSMTANIDIQTDKQEDVIAIPQRAVIIKNGRKIVRVVKGDVIEEAEVETGITGKDGLIEITQGLQEGDKVITFITNNKR